MTFRIGIGIAIVALMGVTLSGCGEQSSEPAAPAEQSTTTPPPANALGGETASGADAQQAADAARGAVEDAAADAEQVVAQIIEEVCAAMTGYLEQMSAAIGSLEGVTDRMSAAAKSPELQGIVEQLQGFADQLGALPDDALTALKSEFSAQLDGLTSRLQSEIDRISSNPDLAGTLGELLKQIPTSLG